VHVKEPFKNVIRKRKLFNNYILTRVFKPGPVVDLAQDQVTGFARVIGF